MAWSIMFESLLVARACDELGSWQGQRSDWLGMPLAGLDELLGVDPMRAALAAIAETVVQRAAARFRLRGTGGRSQASRPR